MILNFVLFSILLLISACSGKIEVSLLDEALNGGSGSLIPNVTIEQAVTETVGTCNFTAASDPSFSVGFSYKITFSKAIDAATFSTADISNSGTGGGTTLTWTLADCGDNTHFMLTASAITGYGTIVPTIAMNTVQDLTGTNNTASTATDNSIRYLLAGWYQEAYIKAGNNEDNDSFGTSVGISGDTIAVSASGEDSSETTITNGPVPSALNGSANSGAVYVYKRTGSTWVQEAYIKESNSDPFDNMGDSVSISGDTLAVGTAGEESNETAINNGPTASLDNSSGSSGAVYVYKRTGNVWAQEAYIKAANNDPSDYLGYQVSLQGDTLAVSALYEESAQTTITNGTGASGDDTAPSSGAVYVYKRTGSTWAQEAYIKAANAEANDGFGEGLSLSGDTLAVGANYEDSRQNTITNGTGASLDNTGADNGAVYVYKRTGTTWAQEAYIKADNTDDYDEFGASVSISGDSLAVGAIYESSNLTTITNGATTSGDNTRASSGAVYVYKRTGTNWAQEAYIKAVNSATNTFFGESVLINGDTLVVGTTNESSNQNFITNGATASNDTSSNSSGAVYVYKRSGTNWAQEAYIKASNSFSFSNYGEQTSMSGDTLVVSARSEKSPVTTITNGETSSTDTSGFNNGAVYVYRNQSRLFDVSEVWATATSTSVTLTWQKSGGLAIGYSYAYQAGATAPADCTSGTFLNVGDVTTATITGLAAASTYSYRVCSQSDGVTFSSGVKGTITTAP